MICDERGSGRLRAPMLPDVRVAPEFHVLRYREREKEFVEAVRMPLSSYDLLCSILKDRLARDPRMAKLRGGYINEETCVFLTLRWLAGGTAISQYLKLGISKSHFYKLLWMTIDAIIYCTDPHLDNIHFPQTEEELHAASEGFESVSYKSAIANCVSVIDGYNLPIKCPSKKDVGNVRSYYSGHYKRYSMNIQAAVDSKCRFQYIAVAGPGVMSDRDALRQCDLFDIIRNLPSPFVSLGDAGYTAFEELATIYTAYYSTRFPKYDNFNFYASQLRIRVEMAFGYMATKWGVLNRKKGLMVKPKNVWRVLVAIARLHNFCINQKDKDWTPQECNRGSTQVEKRKRTDPVEMGHSDVREYMVRTIERRGLKRPRTHNP
jgi:DDE superfamily endonuclease